MRRLAGWLLLAAGLAAALFWLLTIPVRLPAAAIAVTPGDPVRGERIFWAGGCASCHAGQDRLLLGGGAPIVTKFGTFQAPNISPDRVHGIGRWSLADFANAMQRGVSPEGEHLYPAFPYDAYRRMTAGDIADLYTYLRTLPPVAADAPASVVRFPFAIRRGIGLWKRAFLHDDSPMVALPATATAEVRAGQYLVEGVGHCGECHSPRAFGGLAAPSRRLWLAGAPLLEGKGRAPNITPAGSFGKWSADEIAEYLKTGYTPDYDVVGGAMADVQRNMAKLSDADRAAIAAYLKAVPPVADPPKR